jgi:hypothetical protein
MHLLNIHAVQQKCFFDIYLKMLFLPRWKREFGEIPIFVLKYTLEEE